MRTEQEYRELAIVQLSDSKDAALIEHYKTTDMYERIVSATAKTIRDTDAKQEYIGKYVSDYNSLADYVNSWVANAVTAAEPFVGKKVYHKTTGVDKKFLAAIEKQPDKSEENLYLRHSPYGTPSLRAESRTYSALSGITNYIEFTTYDLFILDENGKLVSIGSPSPIQMLDIEIVKQGINEQEINIKEHKKHLEKLSDTAKKIPSPIQELFHIGRNSYGRSY